MHRGERHCVPGECSRSCAITNLRTLKPPFVDIDVLEVASSPAVAAEQGVKSMNHGLGGPRDARTREFGHGGAALDGADRAGVRGTSSRTLGGRRRGETAVSKHFRHWRHVFHVTSIVGSTRPPKPGGWIERGWKVLEGGTRPASPRLPLDDHVRIWDRERALRNK